MFGNKSGCLSKHKHLERREGFMLGPQLMESWFRLVTEAMRGSSEAQNALTMLSGNTMSQDSMMRWMTNFMPTAASSLASPAQAEMFSDWVEQWWKSMGVVPRHRYLEALERNEFLRMRLDECEKAKKMPSLPANVTEQTEQAQKAAMMFWGNMFDETVKAQSEWMKTWAARQHEGQEPAETNTGTEKKAEDAPQSE
jgi:hypothetical protein